MFRIQQLLLSKTKTHKKNCVELKKMQIII